MNRKTKGRYGERLAVKYLIRKGYEVKQQNWYCRWGEIDIIAKDTDTTVFIEVKYRTSAFYGKPHEAINKIKINALRRSIWRYLSINGLYHEKCRLDVVCIDKKGEKHHLQHYKSVTF